MISFFASGQPTAKARARHRQIKPKVGKPFIQTYTPTKTVSYEKMIGSLAKQYMNGRKPSKRPIEIDVVMFFEVPKSWPKWKQEAALNGLIAHTTKPDADNVLKALKDALNDIAWQDDAYVCIGHFAKFYADKPGVQMEVNELNLSPAQITRKDQLILPHQKDLAA